MAEDQEPEIEEMSVQIASGVTSTGDTLALLGVAPSTLYLSDRPERVVGHITVHQFVDDWGLWPNSFESDPPNGRADLWRFGWQQVQRLLHSITGGKETTTEDDR